MLDCLSLSSLFLCLSASFCALFNTPPLNVCPNENVDIIASNRYLLGHMPDVVIHSFPPNTFAKSPPDHLSRQQAEMQGAHAVQKLL
jgi:hypothetical protein